MTCMPKRYPPARFGGPQPTGRLRAPGRPSWLAPVALAVGLACTLVAGLPASAQPNVAPTTAAPSTAPQPVDALRRLVESGQFEQAWQQAQAQPQRLGSVEFDFLYGVAAINVGRVPEGLLALERHLAAAPGNDRARLELARGYFLLGEFARARSEFEFVLRYNPPGPVRQRINEFLDAMQSRQAADRRSASRLYAELGAGHDTNVNQGTWRDEVEFLFGGTVNLDGTPSQAISDSFGSLTLGGQQLLRVSNRLSVFAGIDLEQKRNVDERNFDQGTASAYAGFSQLALGGLWRVTLSSNHLRVGGKAYRNVLQLGSEATWSVSPATQVMAFVQYGEQRYAPASASLDGRATGLGLMVTHAPADWPGQPSIGLRFGFTREDNIARLRDDLDKESPLLRVFASVSPAARWRVAIGAVFLRQSYGAIDVVGFGTRRKDDYLAADFVVSHAIDARWSVRGEAQWSTTRSNQDLYDARRGTVALKLRYQY
jgi:tetratricopeptide (TPR) repeat protein